MLFEAWNRTAWTEALRKRQGGPHDTTDEEQQLRELDTSRHRARRVFEDNEDGSKESAEATEHFFGLGQRRLELLKVIEKRAADERLEEIKYQSEKIAIEGEMAGL